jgi:putative heme-binding domain-containing protein
LESAVPHDSEQAVTLVESAKIPLVRQYVARRLTELLESQPAAANRLIAALPKLSEPAQRDVLAGMQQALQGWHKATPPAAWKEVYAALRDSSDSEVQRLVRELAVVFSDGRAIEELKKIATSNKYDATARSAAVRSLAAARADGLLSLLKGLLADRDIAAEAVRGLAVVDDAESSQLLVTSYGRLTPPAKDAAMGVLTARPKSALALLHAIESGRIDRTHVSVSQIRQMQDYSDSRVSELLQKIWPELRPIAEDKRSRIAELKKQLAPQTLKQANAAAGRTVFDRTCAKCHTLFGEGAKIGPDLTGGQRMNLDYLLENIVDPSATLVANFRMTTIELTDGRVISGVILSRTDQSWEVQTPTEKLVLRPADVERTRDSTNSLMPDGLLDVLQPGEIKDLVAYLMANQQVARP